MNAIEFENISKLYRLGRVGTGTLFGDLNRWWQVDVLHHTDPFLKIGQTNERTCKAKSDFVWALRDINLNVEQGDIVGIIGKNGAGKSTLLKLLSKITAPTTGEIRTRGRIGTLLEVGTGFHPEQTGRENIYMNGALLGMTKGEITSKLDEIVAFSGCEMYIDTPVKRYSSGMKVRLGFAVAAHLNPEILVVDEVLAVGDAEFQKKAIGKMKDVSREHGRTVLFVSHNMAAVKNLCNNGIVLKNGMIDYTGTADACVDWYLKDKTQAAQMATVITNDYRNGDTTRELELLEVKLLNELPELATNEPIQLLIKLHRNETRIKQSQIFIGIRDEDTRLLYYSSAPFDIPDDKTEFEISVKLNNHDLAENAYSIDIEVGQMDFAKHATIYDRVFRVIAFEVRYLDIEHKNGFIHWNARWGRILKQTKVKANDNIEIHIQ